MKIRFVFLCLVMISCAPVPVQFRESEYFSEVFDDVSGTQDELFLKANSWMIETFADPESVIQYSDKEEGVIIGKYLMHGGVSISKYGTIDSRIYAVIDVRVRDNKARIEIKPQASWSVHSYSKEDARLDMVRLAQGFYAALMEDPIQF